jgi:hypothetical protein
MCRGVDLQPVMSKVDPQPSHVGGGPTTRPCRGGSTTRLCRRWVHNSVMVKEWQVRDPVMVKEWRVYIAVLSVGPVFFSSGKFAHSGGGWFWPVCPGISDSSRPTRSGLAALPGGRPLRDACELPHLKIGRPQRRLAKAGPTRRLGRGWSHPAVSEGGFARRSVSGGCTHGWLVSGGSTRYFWRVVAPGGQRGWFARRSVNGWLHSRVAGIGWFHPILLARGGCTRRLVRGGHTARLGAGHGPGTSSAKSRRHAGSLRRSLLRSSHLLIVSRCQLSPSMMVGSTPR